MRCHSSDFMSVFFWHSKNCIVLESECRICYLIAQALLNYHIILSKIPSRQHFAKWNPFGQFTYKITWHDTILHDMTWHQNIKQDQKNSHSFNKYASHSIQNIHSDYFNETQCKPTKKNPRKFILFPFFSSSYCSMIRFIQFTK